MTGGWSQKEFLDFRTSFPIFKRWVLPVLDQGYDLRVRLPNDALSVHLHDSVPCTETEMPLTFRTVSQDGRRGGLQEKADTCGKRRRSPVPGEERRASRREVGGLVHRTPSWRSTLALLSLHFKLRNDAFIQNGEEPEPPTEEPSGILYPAVFCMTLYKEVKHLKCSGMIY